MQDGEDIHEESMALVRLLTEHRTPPAVLWNPRRTTTQARLHCHLHHQSTPGVRLTGSLRSFHPYHSDPLACRVGDVLLRVSRPGFQMLVEADWYPLRTISAPQTKPVRYGTSSMAMCSANFGAGDNNMMVSELRLRMTRSTNEQLR